MRVENFVEVSLLDVECFSDSRGFFRKLLPKSCVDLDIVEINCSFNANVGTLRGMHYQAPPFSEWKAVQCISGSVCDVLVDVRAESDGYLNYAQYILKASQPKLLLIPPGYAHGFQTLEMDTTLIYFHTVKYDVTRDLVVSPLSSILSIEWPLKKFIMSEKDKNAPELP